MIEKKDVEKLVRDPKKSTLKSHFQSMFFIHQLRYSGEIRENEILLWYASPWLRGTYPIYHLTFNAEQKLVKIHTSQNPFDHLLQKIISVLVVFFGALPILGNGFDLGWPATAFVLLVVLALYLILQKATRFEKKIMTEELKDILEQMEKDKSPKNFSTPPSHEVSKANEWTIGKILTRIFLYPLSLIIIYFSWSGLIMSGSLLKRLSGIGVCGAYLYADLYAVFKKR